jgi:hypothetical protein
LKFCRREVALRETADRVVALLERFKTVGDIAVNVDPVHTGLPWAAIRLLLQVCKIGLSSLKASMLLTPTKAAVSDRQQMTALLLGLNRVVYMMSRCKIYEGQYLRGADVTEATSRLESALIELYTHNLQFLALAVRLYNMRGGLRALHAFWKLEDVDKEADICERFQGRAGRAEALKSLLAELEELKDPVDRIDATVAALWVRSNDAERSEILQWISNIPYEDNHITAREKRTEGTGRWLLEDGRFKEWQSSQRSIIIWLHGIRRSISADFNQMLCLTTSQQLELVRRSSFLMSLTISSTIKASKRSHTSTVIAPMTRVGTQRISYAASLNSFLYLRMRTPFRSLLFDCTRRNED